MMKTIALIPLLALFALIQVNAAEQEWMTDYAAALEKAKTESKFVLMDFTGSDWCPPCKLLHEQVFTKPEFNAFAEKNLVLVQVDFPQHKKLSSKQKRANNKLATQYHVEAFPTIILLNSAGKEVNRTEGYAGEDVNKYVANLQKIVEKN